jgi:hypothetical protein
MSAETAPRVCAHCGQDVGLDGVLTIAAGQLVRLCRRCATGLVVTEAAVKAAKATVASRRTSA